MFGQAGELNGYAATGLLRHRIASQTRRTLNYLNVTEDNRKDVQFVLSLLDRFDVKLDPFGDSQTRLERL